MSNAFKAFSDLATIYSRAANGEQSEVVMQEHVEREGQRYYVSTVDTFDHGWETMVFAVKPDGTNDWTDLYSAQYPDRAAAEAGHRSVIEGFTTLPLTDGASAYYCSDADADADDDEGTSDWDKWKN